MVASLSLTREEIIGLVTVLTVVGAMSRYNTGSLALHSRILTLVLSVSLATVAGLATMRWLD